MQYAIEIDTIVILSIFKGSVEHSWGEVENLYDVCVQNFLRNLSVKEFCKLVYICLSYDQKTSLLVFSTYSVLWSTEILGLTSEN